MSATRLLIVTLTTALFLVGFVTAYNIITSEGLPYPGSVVTSQSNKDSLAVNSEGAAPGDPLDRLPTPQRTPVWQLGEPDLIVKLQTSYTLLPEGSDIFRNFVIPNVSGSDRYVRALELRLDNHEAIHHAEFLLDETDASWKADQEEPGSGFSGMDNSSAHHPDGHFVNWVPGKRASELADGLAWRLPAEADLVVQLHMMPADSEVVIDPQIGLYFSDDTNRLSPQMLWLGSRWLPIAAGDPSFKAQDSYELPFDVEVLSVLPHCHYICKDINAWATLPDGSQRQLVKIDEWDFYEQEEYRIKPSLTLPHGTTLSVEFGYDNSTGNRRNPNDPPQDIEFGPLSSNEMADLWIQVMPESERESIDLKRSTARHLQQKKIERQEQLVTIEPDLNGHIELAQNYRRAGRLSETVTQLKKALQLAPENLAVLEGLAIALTNVGRADEAVVHWRRHVQLAPNESQAHINLATALGILNEIVEAQSHLKRATELDPNLPTAFFKLGQVQSYLGRFDEALESFRAALALDPGEPAILDAVARLLATHPDPGKRGPAEALELANRALKQLPRPDSASLSTLATAQAAQGDFALAATTARLALSRITPDKTGLLRPIIQRQIDLYQRGRIEVARAAGEKRFIAPGER